MSATPTLTEADRGKETCPWLIRAQPGQTINITLIDFQAQPKSQQCIALGYIKDESNDQEKMICKSSKREQHFYESAGPSLQIHVGSGNSDHRFLLHYKGISLSYNYLIMDSSCFHFN